MTPTFGQSATCTINNDDQAAQLTLVKVGHQQQRRHRDCRPVDPVRRRAHDISGATGTTAVDIRPSWPPAATTCPRAAARPGYTASGWVCVGGTMPAGDTDTVTLASGRAPPAPSPTTTRPRNSPWSRSVTNNNGGTATAGRLDPDRRPGRRTSAARPARPRRHRRGGRRQLRPVREPGPAGLHRDRLGLRRRPPTGGHDTVTLAVGQSATCTITNDDQAAQLTLVKTVTNDNGGTATAGRLDPVRRRAHRHRGATGTTAVTPPWSPPAATTCPRARPRRLHRERLGLRRRHHPPAPHRHPRTRAERHLHHHQRRRQGVAERHHHPALGAPRLADHQRAAGGRAPTRPPPTPPSRCTTTAAARTRWAPRRWT